MAYTPPLPSYTSSPVNNRMAIFSMVAGIVAWVLFFLLLCLNFGILPLFTVATVGIGSLLYLCAVPVACISPLAWIAGVITGHVAKSQIKQTGEGGNGMATAGLIMGYVGIAITLITLCLVVLGLTGLMAIPFMDPNFYQY